MMSLGQSHLALILACIVHPFQHVPTPTCPIAINNAASVSAHSRPCYTAKQVPPSCSRSESLRLQTDRRFASVILDQSIHPSARWSTQQETKAFTKCT